MTVETLQAATQYSDFKGGSAADRSDKVGPADWLRQNGHMSDGEFLIGVELSVGENHGDHRDPVYVSFLIFEASGYDNVAAHIAQLPDGEPVHVRRKSVQMNLVEFFGLFKRFNVTLSPLDEMKDRQYHYND